MITKEQKTKWLEALRSGKYPKGKGYLCEVEFKSEKVGYCCIGVYQAAVKGTDPLNLVGSLNIQIEGETRKGPKEFYKEMEEELTSLGDSILEIRDYSLEFCLARLNDNTDSFDRVIYYIEKYYPTLD